MWLMLQQESPEDFVVATGVQHSVRDFVCAVAAELGITLRWQGTGHNEEGFDTKAEHRIVAIDPRYFRPAEVDTLLGNPARANEKLGWKPRTTFRELVAEMVREELEIAKLETSGKRRRPACSIT
jgi:GDPmannose 4,6-dehydratase